MALSHDSVVTRFAYVFARDLLAVVAAVAAIGAGSVADAKPTPQQSCTSGRYKAAAAYTACAQKAIAKTELTGFASPFSDKLLKAIAGCLNKYGAAWTKLQKKAQGTHDDCDVPRVTNNQDGTVSDNLTGLQWERKTDDSSAHDKDSLFTWSATSIAASGTVFTTFLGALNTGLFAGHGDWRLPTLVEALTILLAPPPCATSPCIDQTLFGPANVAQTWTATTTVDDIQRAWGVYLADGSPGDHAKTFSFGARAVRGGL
jgi:hypothetical protein